MFDDNGKLLTNSEILSLAETEQGRKQLTNYIYRARVAYATQSIFEKLGITPEAETQQEVCQTIYNVLFNVSVFEIMNYCRSIATNLNAPESEHIGNA